MKIKMPQLKTQYSKVAQKVSKNTETVQTAQTTHAGEEIKYLNTKYRRGYDENEDFTVERERNVSETFNYEQRVIEDGGGVSCVSAGSENSSIISKRPELDHVINGPSTSDSVNGARDLTSDQHTYENLYFDFSGSRELLLHRFFRSTERGDAIYANLCRGCGYGVFEAYGELCYFCASIVNGVQDTPASVGSLSAENLDLVNNSANVYENICENCYAIYSSDECVNCEGSLKTKSEKIKTLSDTNKAKTITLGKSKSFNKRTEKRSIFQGLIGSLKRTPKPVKSVNSKSATRLEIIHNVDGYDNVFRTQETFDLQRICELKRTQTSSSEQHIYGRLKCADIKNSASTQTLPPQLTEISKADSVSDYLNSVSQSSLLNGDEQFSVETNCTTKKAQKLAAKAAKSGKRPRISKLRLLRAITSEQSNNTQEKAKTAAGKQQALYLPDSVCNWMTSLRREIHTYHSCYGDDETVGLCNPKSIPAKNSLLTYYSKLRRSVVDLGDSGDFTLGAINGISTLSTNVLTNYTNSVEEYLKATTPTLITTTNVTNENTKNSPNSDETSFSKNNNNETVVTLREQQQQQTVQQSRVVCNDSNDSPVELAQMVNEFKRNLVAKQYRKQMSKDGNELQQIAETEFQSRKINTEESKVNSMGKNEHEHERKDILRQELRARRQAIYLKVDEQKVHESEQSKNSNDNNEITNNNNNLSGANCLNNEKPYNSNENSENDSMKSATLLSELDSTTFVESPVSRRRTAQAYVSSNSGTLNGNNRKRCGIYEPNVDSTFVSDILNDFDTFLQHEEDAIVARESVENIVATKTEIESQESTTISTQQNDIETIENQRQSQEPNNLTFITAASSSLSALSHERNTPYAAQRDHQHHHKEQLDYRKYSTPESIEQIFDFVKFNENLHLSRSLNNILINYQQPLHAFLVAIRVRFPRTYRHYKQTRLIRKYWRFHAYCIQKLSVKLKTKKCLKRNDAGSEICSAILRSSQSENVSKTMASPVALNGERNSVKIIVQQIEINCGAQAPKFTKNNLQETTTTTTSEVSTNDLEKSSATNETYMTSVDSTQVPITSRNFEKDQNTKTHTPLKPHRTAPKKPEPPQVPQRDPKTALSVRNSEANTPNTPPLPLPNKRESLSNNMTVPTSNSNTNSSATQKQTSTNNSETESIYQPIWKFKTVGEVQERYQTDADYYEIGLGSGNGTTTALTTQTQSNNDEEHDSLSAVLSSNDVEDHGEWETDDEFMFTTEMMSSDKVSLDAQSAEVNSLNSSTALHSTQSSDSLSGSTVAGFSSSTATLASAISTSLTHHLLRNIGIFYSLTEPKLRAIIYDYDRVHASVYFAKRSIQQLPTSTSPCSHDSIESNANDSGIGKTLKEERLPTPPPRTTSAAKSPPSLPKKFSESGCQPAKATPAPAPTISQPLLPDSVQAWKFMLLDVNYLEDEEDMIVSEAEILRSQELKEDIDTRQTQQLNILQRFKSASFGNLVDLPIEDDKKSIAERMRNKLQRGVFKLNVRSPKSDKKNRGIFRRAEATSLYLEDGMKPKYPIFGAPLDQLELDQCIHPNVPRFVVDCVAYIEQKDCIQQEGVYRASGNKVCIEELKQKLSESYIYDPKLLVIDDIHTLTSLLKLFFRELAAPLIPQETYERLGRNLADAAAIETMREAFEEMREPNRSTLKFLIRHLTNVAACSSENRMPASNLAIVWGPCIMSANQIEFDIGRMNTLAKVLIENYSRIFNESERLVA